MWCKNCHYGSEIYQMIPVADNPNAKKCSQCGTVAEDHHGTKPFGQKKDDKPTRNKTKKRKTNEPFFDEVDPDTQGLKALDYSRAQ